ncbi:hypothetical protein Shyhy01_58630 [Streptomyces hygroscopicus subsp. hygroscopicus]|nr:hypothetical protein Shyhy01_58630 [Streptomyces hygroscopicus subsp. hygroscopicus]
MGRATAPAGRAVRGPSAWMPRPGLEPSRETGNRTGVSWRTPTAVTAGSGPAGRRFRGRAGVAPDAAGGYGRPGSPRVWASASDQPAAYARDSRASNSS